MISFLFILQKIFKSSKRIKVFENSKLALNDYHES